MCAVRWLCCMCCTAVWYRLSYRLSECVVSQLSGAVADNAHNEHRAAHHDAARVDVKNQQNYAETLHSAQQHSTTPRRVESEVAYRIKRALPSLCRLVVGVSPRSAPATLRSTIAAIFASPAPTLSTRGGGSGADTHQHGTTCGKTAPRQRVGRGWLMGGVCHRLRSIGPSSTLPVSAAAPGVSERQQQQHRERDEQQPHRPRAATTQQGRQVQTAGCDQESEATDTQLEEACRKKQ